MTDNQEAFIAGILVVAILLEGYLSEIHKFEQDTKAFFLNIFTLKTLFFIILFLIPIFLAVKIINKSKAKKALKELQEQNRRFEKERIKNERLARERKAEEETERVRFEKIQEKLLKKKYPVRKIKKTDSNLKDGQRAYVKKELDEIESRFLITDGFKEVKQTNIFGEKETYLVLDNENESPNHIICVKEIADYLMKFTKDVQTYMSVKPDIVFDAGGADYAIEVETGKIANRKRTAEKANDLKKYYGNRWSFFVTDRNLLYYYSKFGKVMNRRTLKTKIAKIFKKPKNS